MTLRIFNKIAINALGLLVAAVALFPLAWMVLSGFKSNSEILAVPLVFFPSVWDMSNYKQMLFDQSFLRSLGLTLMVSTIGMILSLAVNSMAAYAFARVDFPFKKVLFAYNIMTMFIPGISIMVPSFVLVAKLGMLDSLAVLIIPGVANAFSMFFMRQYYLSIPNSLDEAAVIDGASRLQTYLRIFVPMSAPVFTIMGVTTFIGYYNAFLWPVLTVSDSKLYQIMQYMRFFMSDHGKDWALIMAGTTLVSIPVALLFAVFQRNLVEGIKISGIK